jgi:hypothetical protein
MEQFGGDAWGARRCHYGCGRWLTVETFVPDHFKALARGGRNSLDNLVVCCSVCNDIKRARSTATGSTSCLPASRRCPIRRPRSSVNGSQKSEKAASSVRMLRGQLNRFRTNPQQLQEQI